MRHVETKFKRKLTAELVVEYRRRHVRGEISPRDIAELHGMSYEGVRRMLVGDTWRHIEDALPPEQEAVLVAESAQRILAKVEELKKRDEVVKETLNLANKTPEEIERLRALGAIPDGE